MGTGRTWQTTWDDNRAGEYDGPNTPPTAEISFSSVSNPALTIPPHDSSAQTTSLPSFAQIFPETSSPPTAPISRGRSEHFISKDPIEQPSRAHTSPNRRRDSWRPLFQSTGEHDGSSFSSDLFPESVRRSNFGHSMTLSSEYKPPHDSTTVSRNLARHEQNNQSFMDQSQIRNTDSTIATLTGHCPACTKLRPIVHDIVSEVPALYDPPFRSKLPHEIIQNGLPHALEWVLDVIRSATASVKDLPRRSEQTSLDTQTAKPSPPSKDPQDLILVASELEKRRAEDYGDELQRPKKKARGLSSLELSRASNFSAGAETERRRSHQYVTVPLSSHTPPRAGSSPGSGILPPPSPLQAPYSMRMLPSPSSLSFPTAPPTLPSISSPAASYHIGTSAHTAHLQDLQHQISIKTLAHQTLKGEYDSLIQKLERQRTKCATLEKKFEVTDTEINSLTDEKERLQAQVGTLETQVEDFQHARENERREHSANGTQYMKILEMASRLQEQGAAEKRKWTNEKAELENRIRALEDSGKASGGASEESNDNRRTIAVGEHLSATGISDAPDTAGGTKTGSATMISEDRGTGPSTIVSSQPAESLQIDVVRLSERVRTLESALTAVGASTEAMMGLGRAIRDEAEKALNQKVPLSTASGETPPAAGHDASIPAGAGPSSEPPAT